ncbi:MAG: 50S ribosomal protein L29 [Bacteroidales bacterium]|jgi:large subunit ribosomal protein L29|nr:50S ribosomal protein L29 [Bacteroidales bacterium]MBR5035331.1 50S ribosomal protein L29 [Bacteroidales bacterium]
MKAKEIREMSIKDLEERIETEKHNLSVTKMNHVISPLDNTSVIAKSRRDIARMITILEERKKAENK